MNYQASNISKLISGYAKGSLSEQEKKQLDCWLETEEHRQLFDKALQKNVILAKSIEYDQFRSETVWDNIDQVLFQKRMYRQWLQYAAAIILPLAIGLGVIYLSDREQQSVDMAHQIRPGSSKAVLQLANGDLVPLETNKEQVIKDEGGQVIGVDSLNILAYKPNKTLKTAFNTINIPRGGEYQLILADSTKVWLNSESSLTYPLNFSGSTREVFLTGEAFFDVSTSKDKPFIVKTATANVKVYGTQFNVMCYETNKVSHTTLVEGSVAMIMDGQETLIKPGQQAQININTKQMTVNEVNIDLYTAWKDGVFRFEEMPMQQIADQLGRWYDVDFFFANEEVKNKRFTGAVHRNTDFNLFLDLIQETTKVEMEIKDKTVLVKALY